MKFSKNVLLICSQFSLSLYKSSAHEEIKTKYATQARIKKGSKDVENIPRKAENAKRIKEDHDDEPPTVRLDPLHVSTPSEGLVAFMEIQSSPIIPCNIGSQCNIGDGIVPSEQATGEYGEAGTPSGSGSVVRLS
eukprot:PhF_6_TR37967/c0_g1_i1/m.56720